jgi:high-affinity K+ transport system ATPase subunit B
VGITAYTLGRADVADLCFTFATVPVIAGLAVSIVRDRLMVQAGEIVPVDGGVTSVPAIVDESALTGEPIPVAKPGGAAMRMIETLVRMHTVQEDDIYEAVEARTAA